MTSADVPRLLEQFRERRRAFQRRLDQIPAEDRSRPPGPGERSAREIAVCVAAWLEEANDRIPRLMAGAPEIDHDADAFNAAAIARGMDWSDEQALGAFRRAADRFDMMIAESNADELADEPAVMRRLRSMTDALTAELAGLDRLIADLESRSSDR